MSEEEKDSGSKYFNVERFRRVYARTSMPRGRLGRFIGRITGFFDSVQGFFIVLLALPVMFGSVLAVVVGSYFGPLAFIGILGSIIGGLAFYAERKVGRSMQFGEYNFFRRTVATAMAFLVALGIIFLLIHLSKL